MTKLEFMEGVNILQDNYNRKLSVNQLKFMPTIAEIRGNEQRMQYGNYDQREYENIDFNKFYAN